MKNHAMAIITVSFLLLMTFLIPNSLAQTVKIDKTAVASTVIDGSSFTLNSGETVKLASIDTPLLGENGYTESKNYLSSLIQGKTVILNIDTITRTDQNGRLLCLAYLDYNSTYYENVNMAMLQSHYAAPSNLNNTEFNPTTWTWFVSKQAPASSPTATPAQTPTATPTPTPFSAPTPSVSPDVPELSTSIIVLIISLTTMALILQLYGRRKK